MFAPVKAPVPNHILLLALRPAVSLPTSLGQNREDWCLSRFSVVSMQKRSDKRGFSVSNQKVALEIDFSGAIGASILSYERLSVDNSCTGLY
jgi:hypothetical protein